MSGVFRTLACSALVAAAMGAPAQAQHPQPQPQAQPERPPIEVRKVDGTENVCCFRNRNHQAMFIVTPEGVIATDPVSYGRPTGGQDYIAEIRKITQAPIRYLIYSHHHFDHIAGGKAFKDAGATIVAHKRAKERLEVLKDPAHAGSRRDRQHQPHHHARRDHAGAQLCRSQSLQFNAGDAAAAGEGWFFIVNFLPVGRVPGRGMIDFHPLEAETRSRKCSRWIGTG